MDVESLHGMIYIKGNWYKPFLSTKNKTIQKMHDSLYIIPSFCRFSVQEGSTTTTTFERLRFWAC